MEVLQILSLFIEFKPIIWDPNCKFSYVYAMLQANSLKMQVNPFFLLFIRPFEKRSYYAVAMSVRPSVNMNFPDFFQHALRSLWSTLQPKVG